MAERLVNWGQVAISVAMLGLGLVLTTVMVDHSSAIAENRRSISVNSNILEHLKNDAMTVREREELCASIATLRQSVDQLVKQVDRLDRIVMKRENSQ